MPTRPSDKVERGTNADFWTEARELAEDVEFFEIFILSWAASTPDWPINATTHIPFDMVNWKA